MASAPLPTPCEIRPFVREAPLSLEDQELARTLVAPRRIDAASRIARSVALTCLLSAPFTVGVMLGLDVGLGLGLLGLVAVVGLVELGAYLAIRRGGYSDTSSWALAAVEVSIPAAVQILDTIHIGPAYAMTSAPILLYVPAFLCSVLRLQPRLCLFIGGLGAAELLGLYLWQRQGLAGETLASLAWANQLQRVAYLLLAGACAHWICRGIVRGVGDIIIAVGEHLRTRAVLGTQVTEQVAAVLLSPERPRAEKREITVLFSDIRGFTGFSERRDAAEVVAFLSGYFEAMCAVVARHRGTVNKFLGDGMMAFWNAPADDPAHAEHAVRAAAEMLAEVGRLRAEGGVPELDIGVGVHTGEAVVGLLGSAARSEYTAIGDVVNVAARIEGLNKEHRTRVLLSEETRGRLPAGIAVREVGACQVKGRDAPVRVYELLETR